MQAVIVTGGKQYKVQQGDVLFVEKLEAEEGAEVKFDTVLAVGEEGAVKFGAPSVEGASVAAKVVKNGKTIACYFADEIAGFAFHLVQA